MLKSKPAKSQRRPQTSKLEYKNRWLISRDVVAHLRQAGVVCNIIVPEHMWLTEDRAMSPGERAAFALINSGFLGDDPKVEEVPEIAAAMREIKRLN